MNRFCLLFLLIIISVIRCTTKEQKVLSYETGNIIHIDSFPSTAVDPRSVHIWLPSDYDSTKKYAVVYMHDGQMLFDSSNTWNKKEWQVDETMNRLLTDGKIKDAIVVGIDNNGSRRISEYFPEAVFAEVPDEISDQLLSAQLSGEPLGNEYLEFLVLELKPYIDSVYSTHSDHGNTFVMGSSMGGLISLYAICEYPKVFGGAACISTHWPLAFFKDTETFDWPLTYRHYLENNLPSPTDHKIYFDHGTATLDSLYAPHQILVDSIMIIHGYTSDNWMTKVFPGDEHSEVPWARRLHIPLEFLLGISRERH